MILLDTTILVYAVGDAHPLRDACRRLLVAHADGAIEATTTVEVIQEFMHVRARRRGRGDSADLARRFLAAFDLIETSADDLNLGLTLFAEHQELGAFDAVLAAVALDRGLRLVSADHAFRAVPGLIWIDPAMPDVASLLRE